MTNRAEFIIVWLALARLGVVSAWINYNLRNHALSHTILKAGNAKALILSEELQEGRFSASACHCALSHRRSYHEWAPADRSAYFHLA